MNLDSFLKHEFIMVGYIRLPGGIKDLSDKLVEKAGGYEAVFEVGTQRYRSYIRDVEARDTLTIGDAKWFYNQLTGMVNGNAWIPTEVTLYLNNRIISIETFPAYLG
ncbi:hypothetical protein EC968_002664 [Mortierella alpina]|nr:hypothetical protein EC968_002664 [Mortierella alpina]